MGIQIIIKIKKYPLKTLLALPDGKKSKEIPITAKPLQISKKSPKELALLRFKIPEPEPRRTEGDRPRMQAPETREAMVIRRRWTELGFGHPRRSRRRTKDERMRPGEQVTAFKESALFIQNMVLTCAYNFIRWILLKIRFSKMESSYSL